MEFNKGICSVLHLQRNSFMHQYRLGSTEEQLGREESQAPGRNKVEYEPAVFLGAKADTSLLGCNRQSMISRGADVILPFCSSVRHIWSVVTSDGLLSTQKDMDVLQSVQPRAMKVMMGIENPLRG